MKFILSSQFAPSGDQPKAIEKLVQGLNKKFAHQTLMGVTGSGKTFTIANVIAKIQKPTLIISHNKTLAAQLCQEFRNFFPKNAVEYFVSYYDYYQPEAYLASTDTYIEKEAEINQEIERLRHSATSALMTRQDVIVVSSVSCIYGLGTPEEYKESILELKIGQVRRREELITDLINLYYDRSDVLTSGKFRARGESVEISPPSSEIIIRVDLENDKIKKITEFEALTRKVLHTYNDRETCNIIPAKHFVVSPQTLSSAVKEIKNDLKKRLEYFKKEGKLLEAERLERRTNYDLEMMQEIGYCNGIENYSRYLTSRAPGQPPYTLLDYFSKDFLVIVDESHVTIPQIQGMYEGDRSRKNALIEYGFRLPSALDNRPLKFKEFEHHINQSIYTTATPGKYEKEKSAQVVEQIIRPTGLIDPEIVIRKTENQVQDTIKECQKEITLGNRVLITTLTKKMAEDLSGFLKEKGLKSEYLHSEVETLERIRILENLRRGKIDILVGVNLLREGLDLPEVSLVTILDADKEGFLRSETSLVQTMGRAARNISGRVILYADEITGSIERAIKETNRRRKLQVSYNKKHHITPTTIKKKIASIIPTEEQKPVKEFTDLVNLEDIPKIIAGKEREMRQLAKDLRFEEAMLVRDEVKELKKLTKGL